MNLGRVAVLLFVGAASRDRRSFQRRLVAAIIEAGADSAIAAPAATAGSISHKAQAPTAMVR